MVIGEPWRNQEPTGLFTQEQNLEKLQCQATSVISGVVKSKSSQLTDDHKSVFTDYDLEIDDVFKDDSPLSLQKGGVITVTFLGGAVGLNGRIIRVYNKSYRYLKVGSSFVLFLTYLADADSFKPSDVDGIYEITGNRVESYNDTDKYQADIITDSDEFLRHLHKFNPPCLTMTSE